ncbi:MAG: CRISPR-associated endoribonuclease Cas6 [Aliarcobacter sp.]
MKIFELKCEAYIKSDINLRNSYDILAKYINFCIAEDKKINQISKTKWINNYCFGNFYPTESNKIYKSGKIYKFIIRSLDEELIDELMFTLKRNDSNLFFQVISTNKTGIEQFFISELYSATPVIVSDRRDENGRQLYWSLDYNGDIDSLQKRLQRNLEKKLKQFCSEEINMEDNFIQEIELKNQKPQSIYFKKSNKDDKLVRLIGNKLKIVPNKDSLSQKLAFLSLAVGLGEKSSFGGGFCLSR